MRIFIKCPNCGEIDYYTQVEHVRQYRKYDAYQNDLGLSKREEPFYKGVTKRCPYCGKRVEIAIEGGVE